MSFAANVTAAPQQQGNLEILLLFAAITLSCCVFLFINGIMLFTLRSKVVFRETSRYVLLFNLLCADTIQMALSQLLYLLAVCRVRLTYPVCGLIVMLANLTNEISPLTLVVMSLERYVVVCYPLRHSAITTIRNTAVAIAVIWAFSSLNIITRVVLLLEFPFDKLENLQMKDPCGTLVMFLGSMSDEYNKVYTYLLFVSAGLAVASSYLGVMIAARSHSTDKASAHKACNTLLLHLVQLGLSLCSTMHNSFMVALSRTVRRLVFIRVQTVFYVLFIILPKCLSSLVYGLRDRTIRPTFVYHLCCQLKLSIAKAEV